MDREVTRRLLEFTFTDVSAEIYTKAECEKYSSIRFFIS